MTKRCRHEWEQKPDYPEHIICQKCQSIRRVELLTLQQFETLPLELRRSILMYLDKDGQFSPYELFGGKPPKRTELNMDDVRKQWASGEGMMIDAGRIERGE